MKNNYEINIYENLIHIKNYINIIDIKNNIIEIKLLKNNLKIKGNNLLINKLDKYELCISGILKGIEFTNE